MFQPPGERKRNRSLMVAARRNRKTAALQNLHSDLQNHLTHRGPSFHQALSIAGLCQWEHPINDRLPAARGEQLEHRLPGGAQHFRSGSPVAASAVANDRFVLREKWAELERWRW